MLHARWPLLIALATFAAGVSSSADALDFEITPSLGYRAFGDFDEPVTAEKVDIEPAIAFALAFDVSYKPDEAWQIFYSRQSTEVTDVDPTIDLDVEYFQVGGVAEFPLEGDFFIPYAVGTIGAARFTPSGGLDDETRFAATLGGGWKYYFNDHMGLRFEVRGYLTFFDSESDIFCLSDETGATCRLRTAGSVVWQLDAQAGFTYRF